MVLFYGLCFNSLVPATPFLHFTFSWVTVCSFQEVTFLSFSSWFLLIWFPLLGWLTIYRFFPKPSKHLSTSYWEIIRSLEVASYPFHTRPCFYRYSNSVISKSCWWSEVPANFSENMDSQAAAQINWIIITKCLLQEFIFVFKSLTCNQVQ